MRSTATGQSGPVLPLIPGHEVTGHVAGARRRCYRIPQGRSRRRALDVERLRPLRSLSRRHGDDLPHRPGDRLFQGGRLCGIHGGAAPISSRKLPKRADLIAIAPILCAGVTTYRGLKRTNTRPGQWVAVVGIGGLGHIAVQYAVAMGMRVAAVDIDPKKLALGEEARRRVPGQCPRGEPGLGDPQGNRRRPWRGRGRGRDPGLRAGDRHAAGRRHRWCSSACPAARRMSSAPRSRRFPAASSRCAAPRVGTRLDLEEAVAFALRGEVAAKIETAPLSAGQCGAEPHAQGQDRRPRGADDPLSRPGLAAAQAIRPDHQQEARDEDHRGDRRVERRGADGDSGEDEGRQGSRPSRRGCRSDRSFPSSAGRRRSPPRRCPARAAAGSHSDRLARVEAPLSRAASSRVASR